MEHIAEDFIKYMKSLEKNRKFNMSHEKVLKIVTNLDIELTKIGKKLNGLIDNKIQITDVKSNKLIKLEPYWVLT